jgi:putative PEP-CTERM system TPR-repeat lipoprotein
MILSPSMLTLRPRRALVVLAALLLSACGQPAPEKLMASAKDYLARGDRSAAVIQLKNLLIASPDNGEARLLLGQALVETEDYAAGEKELSRALELRQPHEKVLPLYARALLAQGKYQAVVAEVEKYRLFDPPAVAATRTALGDAYMRLGRVERAAEAYAAALAAVPDFSRARLGEATILGVEGRLDEALQRVEEVIANEPKLAEAHAFRADVFLAKGDGEGAKKALLQAIAARERYLPARLTLIRLLTDERDFEEAATLIETTRKVAPGDLRVTYLDANLAQRKGDLERARQQVQVVLKYLPEDVQALVLAGAIEIQADQLPLAEDYLRRALGRAPGHQAARRLLIAALLRMGQPARAKEVLQPLVERGMPGDARLLLLAGETYLANGDVKQATAFFQSAAGAGEAPGAAAKTRLGQIALAAGNVDEGFRELEAASELDAGQYQADLAIIAGHLRHNELDKAMKAVEALERKQPKNPLTFQMYGVVNIARGEAQAARASFEKALELQPAYFPAALGLAQLDLLAGRPQDAVGRYEKLIDRQPSNEQAYVALAELQERTGLAAKDVAATLRRGIAANPQSAAIRVALVNLLLRAGEVKAALTAAQEALAAQPSDPRVIEAAGVAQEAAGEINQAIETFGKLAALQPRNLQPLYRLAALYMRQRETDKAVESLRRAQKIAPRERDVTPQLVATYLAAKRFEDAFREARDLQKREPKFAGGFSLEGDLHMSRKAYADAERAYRLAISLAPKSHEVAVRLHAALTAAGKPKEAQLWAKKWIAENPQDVAMRLHLGGTELAAGNLKASAGHYQAAVAVQPKNVLALNNLAWIGGELGDPAALGHAERAFKLAPNAASVLDTYGMLLVRKGDTEKALPLLQRASSLEPARHELRLNYAKALIKAGRKGEARVELEALSKVDENFAGKEEVASLLKSL